MNEKSQIRYQYIQHSTQATMQKCQCIGPANACKQLIKYSYLVLRIRRHTPACLNINTTISSVKIAFAIAGFAGPDLAPFIPFVESLNSAFTYKWM